MSTPAGLKANPFCVLGVTTRDNRRKIVEVAEERALHGDHTLCQAARSQLTNPMARLSAEIAWMPGVSPRVAEALVEVLSENPAAIRAEARGLPRLARANSLATAFERAAVSEDRTSSTAAMLELALVVESIDSSEVLLAINEDRAVAGFPAVKDLTAIENALAERRKFYRSVLRTHLDSMDSADLVAAMTDLVSEATGNGTHHAPSLVDEITDTYEVETQTFLDREHQELQRWIAHAKVDPKVKSSLDAIEKIARNWDKVAQPIQISARARGTRHRASDKLVGELRNLSIHLANERSLYADASRLTRLLQDLFAELPEAADRLAQDAAQLEELQRQEREARQNRSEIEEAATFKSEVGIVFKEALEISPEGILWNGTRYPLDSITRVRWGSIRTSVNGIPSGTYYTIGFGDNRSTQKIQLRRESTFSGFLQAFLAGVFPRLVVSMHEALESGTSFTFGDLVVEDAAVTLRKRRLLRFSEPVRLKWNEVEVGSANGRFVITKKGDASIQGSASYIDDWNTHVLEHMIRGAFKCGASTLGGYLRR